MGVLYPGVGHAQLPKKAPPSIFEPVRLGKIYLPLIKALMYSSGKLV